MKSGSGYNLLLGFTSHYDGLFMLLKSSVTETELSVPEMKTQTCVLWKFFLWFPWVFNQAEEWQRPQVFTVAFSPNFNPYLITSICYALYKPLCINPITTKHMCQCLAGLWPQGRAFWGTEAQNDQDKNHKTEIKKYSLSTAFIWLWGVSPLQLLFSQMSMSQQIYEEQ